MKKLFLVICFLTAFLFSMGQEKKIRIVRADALQFDKDIKDAQQLIGNVIFEHDSAFMFCDTALLFTQENSFIAYSSVKIKQGDSIRITADTLIYSGKGKTAELKGNVFFTDGKMKMTTPQLDYNLTTKIGKYTQGATITSEENNNTLVSKIGIYNSISKTLLFKDSVQLSNPRYTINSDTLIYNTASEIAYFHGSTSILSDSNSIYCRHGWYNTKTEQSSFWQHSRLETPTQMLSGDSIYYDRNKGIGEAFGNVLIRDTSSNIDVIGGYAFYNEIVDSSLIADSPIFIQYFDTDTLLLTADTLIIKEDTISHKRSFKAFYNVLLFKSDLQARCDSLVYSEEDSSMLFRHNPIIWSEVNQLTGKEIDVKINNGNVHHLHIKNKALIMSEADTSGHYNQIQGKTIDGYFGKENKIETVWVKGNGEVLYYLGEDNKPITDVNHSLCSSMKILLKDNEIERIKFYNKPTAKLKPLNTLSDKELFLTNFRWEQDKRPKRKDFSIE